MWNLCLLIVQCRCCLFGGLDVDTVGTGECRRACYFGNQKKKLIRTCFRAGVCTRHGSWLLLGLVLFSRCSISGIRCRRVLLLLYCQDVWLCCAFVSVHGSASSLSSAVPGFRGALNGRKKTNKGKHTSDGGSTEGVPGEDEGGAEESGHGSFLCRKG